MFVGLRAGALKAGCRGIWTRAPSAALAPLARASVSKRPAADSGPFTICSPVLASRLRRPSRPARAPLPRWVTSVSPAPPRQASAFQASGTRDLAQPTLTPSLTSPSLRHLRCVHRRGHHLEQERDRGRVGLQLVRQALHRRRPRHCHRHRRRRCLHLGCQAHLLRLARQGDHNQVEQH